MDLLRHEALERMWTASLHLQLERNNENAVQFLNLQISLKATQQLQAMWILRNNCLSCLTQRYLLKEMSL